MGHYKTDDICYTGHDAFTGTVTILSSLIIRHLLYPINTIVKIWGAVAVKKQRSLLRGVEMESTRVGLLVALLIGHLAINHCLMSTLSTLSTLSTFFYFDYPVQLGWP